MSSTGSRFIVPAIAALGVSVVSAGFLAARRIHDRPAAAATSVSAELPVTAEPTPTAEPAPAAVPSPVATPAVEPEPEIVVSKPAAPKPIARTATKTRTSTPAPAPRPAPAREVVVAPAPEPVIESPAPPPAPTPKETKSTATVDSVPAPPRAAVVETAPVEGPRPQLEQYTVQADSVLGIRIDQSLSSATAKLEDPVSATLSRDVIVNGKTVVPAGTRLEGNVTLVQSGSKFKGRARLGIRFYTMVLADGSRVPIKTETLYRDGESATGSTATKVGGGAAAGAILGGLLGGKKGAIIGAGVGVAGGTAAVIAGDAKDAEIDSGSQFTMRVTNPVTLTIERGRS